MIESILQQIHYREFILCNAQEHYQHVTVFVARAISVNITKLIPLLILTLHS